jgi:hypothetical protein
MASKELLELMERADQLPMRDQLELIAHVAEQVRQSQVESKPRRKWREIRGSAPYPLMGEDAQAWVSRTRRESDEQRASQWDNRP